MCISNLNNWQKPFWKYPSCNKLTDKLIPFLCWRTYPGIASYKEIFFTKDSDPVVLITALQARKKTAVLSNAKNQLTVETSQWGETENTGI